ncbi:hypothetical protein Tco_1154738 [Tanacetum coccineum]
MMALSPNYFGKFPSYPPSNEEEEPNKGPNYQLLSYTVSDSDSDLESKLVVDLRIVSWKTHVKVEFDPIPDYPNGLHAVEAVGMVDNDGQRSVLFKGSWHAYPKEDDRKGGCDSTYRWHREDKVFLNMNGSLQPIKDDSLDV